MALLAIKEKKSFAVVMRFFRNKRGRRRIKEKERERERKKRIELSECASDLLAEISELLLLLC